MSPNLEKPKKSISLVLLALVSAVVIPACVIVFSAYQTLMSPSLYTNILKRADLISTFIQARNFQLDTESRQRIETELNISETERELLEARNDYETEKSRFDNLNRTEEYDKLKNERRETSDLSWSKASGLFNDKAEFKAYKKTQLAKIDGQLKEISSYRKSVKDSLRSAKRALEAAENRAEALAKELRAKEKKAKKILKENKNSFSGKLFADIEAVTPELTTVLNERVIDGQVYGIAENLIAFISGKDEQANSISYDVDPVTGLAGLRIRLPETAINLRAEDGRHLLSDVFVDIIRRHRELNNANFLIKVFRFTETGLGEKIGSSFLKDAGLRIRGDRIFLEKRVLSGSAAETLYKIMTAASKKNFFLLGVPAVAAAFLLLMLVYPAPWRQRITAVYRVLIYSSAAALVLWAIGLGLINSSEFSVGSVYASAYLQPALSTVYLSVMLPKAFIIFAALMTIGNLLKFLTLRKDRKQK